MGGERNDVELLLPHARPVQARPRMSKLPFFQVALCTFEVTLRTLAALAQGKASIQTGDDILVEWWPRVFRYGNASLRARGRHHLQPGQAYVFMSNHCSLLDIPAMFGAVPGSLRMVTKEELIRVPLWGYAMKKVGFIPIDRKNRVKAIRQLEVAKDMLRQGVSVWISPEGTRARDGKLARFKRGGFHLALDLGAPIIPVWIEGTQGVIAPDQLAAREDGEVEVRFGAPLSTAGLTKDDMDDVMGQVREAMLDLSGRRAEVDGEAKASAPAPAVRLAG